MARTKLTGRPTHGDDQARNLSLQEGRTASPDSAFQTNAQNQTHQQPGDQIQPQELTRKQPQPLIQAHSQASAPVAVHPPDDDQPFTRRQAQELFQIIREQASKVQALEHQLGQRTTENHQPPNQDLRSMEIEERLKMEEERNRRLEEHLKALE